MKKIALAIIALIGTYVFLRNNVGKLPDQIILTTHSDIFYKAFIPLLMLVSAIVSFIKKEKINYFYLSVFTLFIDTINRLAAFINFYYQYLTYDYTPAPVKSANVITVKVSPVPSLIILFIEIITLVFLFRYSSVGSSLKTRIDS